LHDVFHLRESLDEQYILGPNEIRRVTLDVPDIPPGLVWLEPTPNLQASSLDCPSGPFEVTARRTCEVLLRNMTDEHKVVDKGLAVVHTRKLTDEESVIAEALSAHELGEEASEEKTCFRHSPTTSHDPPPGRSSNAPHWSIWKWTVLVLGLPRSSLAQCIAKDLSSHRNKWESMRVPQDPPQIFVGQISLVQIISVL